MSYMLVLSGVIHKEAFDSQLGLLKSPCKDPIQLERFGEPHTYTL